MIVEQAETQFFNTEIMMKRPSTTAVAGRHSQNAFHRLRELKDQVKCLDEDYKRALSQVTKTQTSVSKINRTTQKIRVDFLKFYENKKMKLTNRQLVQGKKMEEKNHFSQVMRQTKQRKIMEQLQLSATKNEEQDKNTVKQQKNKREKQWVKKAIKTKSFDEHMAAKSSYNRIREEKSYISFRNKKIQEIMVMRGKLNYAEQVEKQMEMIKEYQKILDHFQNIQTERPGTTSSFSRNFFITSQKVNSKPSTRGRDTSHTARTAK